METILYILSAVLYFGVGFVVLLLLEIFSKDKTRRSQIPITRKFVIVFFWPVVLFVYLLTPKGMFILDIKEWL